MASTTTSNAVDLSYLLKPRVPPAATPIQVPVAEPLGMDPSVMGGLLPKGVPLGADGKPIPVGEQSLQQQMEELKKSYDSEYENKLAEMTSGKSAVEVKPAVDISTLPPDEQEKYYATLEKSGVVTGRPTAPPAQANKVVLPAAPQPESKPEQEKSPLLTPSSSAPPPNHVCRNCNWPSEVDPGEPDDQDKNNYLVHVMGAGNGSPFFKEYRMFRGKGHVRFRNLTGRERDAIDAAAHQKYVENGRESPGIYAEWLMKYRLALQVSEYGMGNDVHRFPTGLSLTANTWAGEDVYNMPDDAEAVESWEIGRKDQNRVHLVFEYVSSKILRSQSVEDLLLQFLNNFIRVEKKLAANVNDDSFWPEN